MTEAPALSRPDPATTAGLVGFGRMAVAACVFLAWESVRWFGDPRWTSYPTAILARLWRWLGQDLWLHVGTTFGEMAIGLAIGVPAGAVLGLLLGRSASAGRIFGPIVVALYNVPIVAIAPLLILWFGLGLTPKVVLVALVTFFLLFFSTFTGAQSIDRDLVASMRLLGANRRELFWKLLLPASGVWIVAGIKLALPYALIDAVVGELLAARQGVGFLLSSAVAQIDMTGTYAALTVLMAMGVAVFAMAQKVEGLLMPWRSAGR